MDNKILNMDEYYTSLLGYKCQTKSKKTIEYPIELLELFNDPLTFNPMKYPILIDDHPFVIYDLDNLIKWFCQSNKEPFSGVDLTKLIKFSTVINFFVAMVLLEEKDDKLIFHIPNIDLINLFELIRYTITYNNNKKNIQNNNMTTNINTDNKIIQLDIEYYYEKPVDKTIKKYNIYTDLTGCQLVAEIKNPKIINCSGMPVSESYFENYYNYNLVDILLNDIVSGKPLIDPIILNDYNIILDKSILRNRKSYRIPSIESYIIKHDEKKPLIDCKILFNKIKTAFNNCNIELTFKEKNYENCINDDTKYNFYEIFDHTKKSLNLRNSDFYMSSNTTYQYMYNEYRKLVDSNLENKYLNFKEKKRFLSNMIKNNIDILLKPNYGTAILGKYKSEIGFPVLSQYDGYYCDDFSLLDLDNIKITNGNNLKGRDFIGTNFTNTEFVNVDFNLNSFVGSNLKNTKFINCKFKECVFYKSLTNNTHLINCEFDNKTISIINKEYKNKIFKEKDGHYYIDA